MIGIGAGPATDGQVLVFHDLLGIYERPRRRGSCKRYADVRGEMVDGVGAYAEEVRRRRFPADEHTYSIDPAELEEFRRYLARRASRAARHAWDW